MDDISHPCIVPLFVPGDRPERFPKAATSGADAIIIDLEDAVAAEAKSAARDEMARYRAPVPTIVRANAVDTPWHDADVRAARASGASAIMLPKAELGAGLSALAGAADGVRIIALVETAKGMAEARAIASMPGVIRLAFGSIDYCADLGCAHTREALLAARSELVLASRLADLAPPLDGVTTSIDDPALIEDDARHALSLGFGGKLCIHPRQLDTARAGFRPQEAEIAWARRVVAAGHGAVAIDGAMVDAPVKLRAMAILARVDKDRSPMDGQG